MYLVTNSVTAMSYDTINFKLQQSEVNGCIFIEEIPCYLNNVSEHYYPDGSVAVVGDVGCYRVSVNRKQLKVKDCSLTKWFLGDNFKEMSRGDTQRAIEKLSDLIHVPMDKAVVTRLDFAINIITKHPVTVYLNHLGELNHYCRMEQPTSLYYTQNKEQFVFYDKVKEQKRAGGIIPELYRDRQVLRIEQRYIKRVSDRLNYPYVSGAMLYDVEFFNMLYRRLGDTYKSIKKINDFTINIEAMKSKKDLYKLGVLSLIQQAGGVTEMLEQIKEAQERGGLTKKQALDLRTAVNEASKVTDDIVVPNEAIAELDEKINKAIKFNLSY